MTASALTLAWSGAITLCLFYAGLSDIATRAIPNAINLAVVVLAVPMRLKEGNLAGGVIVVLAVFCVLAAAWVLRAIGGGDVKLWSACSLLFPPSWLAQSGFLLRVLLTGGVLAITYLVLRCVARVWRPTLHRGHGQWLGRLWRIEFWRARRGASIPYGVAISVAAFCTLWLHALWPNVLWPNVLWPYRHG